MLRSKDVREIFKIADARGILLIRKSWFRSLEYLQKVQVLYYICFDKKYILDPESFRDLRADAFRFMPEEVCGGQ